MLGPLSRRPLEPEILAYTLLRAATARASAVAAAARSGSRGPGAGPGEARPLPAAAREEAAALWAEARSLASMLTTSLTLRLGAGGPERCPADAAGSLALASALVVGAATNLAAAAGEAPARRGGDPPLAGADLAEAAAAAVAAGPWLDALHPRPAADTADADSKMAAATAARAASADALARGAIRCAARACGAASSGGASLEQAATALLSAVVVTFGVGAGSVSSPSPPATSTSLRARALIPLTHAAAALVANDTIAESPGGGKAAAAALAALRAAVDAAGNLTGDGFDSDARRGAAVAAEELCSLLCRLLGENGGGVDGWSKAPEAAADGNGGRMSATAIPRAGPRGYGRRSDLLRLARLSPLIGAAPANLLAASVRLASREEATLGGGEGGGASRGSRDGPRPSTSASVDATDDAASGAVAALLAPVVRGGWEGIAGRSGVGGIEAGFPLGGGTARRAVAGGSRGGQAVGRPPIHLGCRRKGRPQRRLPSPSPGPRTD